MAIAPLPDPNDGQREQCGEDRPEGLPQHRAAAAVQQPKHLPVPATAIRPTTSSSDARTISTPILATSCPKGRAARK